MKEIVTKEADVLIVGTGLAGLRAGISACNHNTDTRVVIVSDTTGPSGSSFTNINNALGLLVCHTDGEKETFMKRAISIASPGTIIPGLVRILADESERIFFDLKNMGFQFKNGADGNPMRFPACFLREKPLAYVFTHLHQAHASMKNRYLACGGKFMHSWILQELVMDSNKRFAGALFESLCGKRQLAVKGKSVIIAAGGNASLFHRTVSGSGSHGFAAAIMKRAGVDLVNMNYFQSLWYETKHMIHWPPWQVASPGFRFRNAQGRETDIPGEIMHLSTDRARHVPISNGMPDSKLDHFLFENLDRNGELDIFSPEKGWVKVAPFAHASNGGAIVDENGSTGIHGVFSCGESSGGMHGANRVGGAMVLSTQVFGERAGVHAAQHAQNHVDETHVFFQELIRDTLSRHRRNDAQWQNDLPGMKKQLQKTIIQGTRQEKLAHLANCREKLKTAMDWRFRLAIETMILLLEKTA